MKRYFNGEIPFSELARAYPELTRDRARYKAEEVRDVLLKTSSFRDDQIVPYLLFPFDLRCIYYEADAKFLNERRPELWESLVDNEFLLSVPQGRRPSEALPLITTTLYDLHVHDRGSAGFPAEIKVARISRDSNIGGANRVANINEAVAAGLRKKWNLGGAESDSKLVRDLFRLVIATVYAPDYLDENRDHVTYDWAHVPIPHEYESFQRLASEGDRVAALLNPAANVEQNLNDVLGSMRAGLASLHSDKSEHVSPEDLRLTYSYFGAAQGSWRSHSELPLSWPECWGETTGDLYINDDISFTNVPEKVWRFELGGYPVLKKWLGYRRANQRGGMPLLLDEVSQLRSVVHRLAALLLMQDQLNELYHAAAENSFSCEDFEI